MQPEETTMDMPDAEEIPGQEHIHVPRMREFQDTTISSDDEEGKNVFAEEEELDDQDTDFTPEEIELLSRTDISMSGIDDEDRRKLMLDKTDFDGELLNEKDNISGEQQLQPRR
jgi:hypothetical protein